MKPWNPSDEERWAIAEVIEAARQVQTFLWGEANGSWGLEEWLRMFRKRVAKLEEIERDNPHAAVELKKRLLQTAALAVALIGIIDRDGVPWDKADDAPPSNLPQHAQPDAQEVLERIKGHLEDFQKWYEGDGYVYFGLSKHQGETLLKIAKEVAFAGGKLWG